MDWLLTAVGSGGRGAVLETARLWVQNLLSHELLLGRPLLHLPSYWLPPPPTVISTDITPVIDGTIACMSSALAGGLLVASAIES